MSLNICFQKANFSNVRIKKICENLNLDPQGQKVYFIKRNKVESEGVELTKHYMQNYYYYLSQSYKKIPVARKSTSIIRTKQTQFKLYPEFRAKI